MDIDLRPISVNQKQKLKIMLKAYERELTGEDDPPEYKYLNLYWEKENRKPYFIVADGNIVGFTLINKHTLVQKDGFNIAEFYIRNNWRNKGIGKTAAFKLFDLYPGSWEIRQLKKNIKAKSFWKKIVSEYTNSNYQEKWLDDENWNGSVQTFNN